MKNEIQVFRSEEIGAVRTVMIDGDVWFVGNDVASALGYQKPDQAIRANVSEEDSTLMGVSDANNHTQRMKVINESGVYDLIFESRLPSAKKFRRWVTSDILPTIRKTGSYIMEKKDSYLIDNPAERARRWAEEYDERIRLEQSNVSLMEENESMKPKALVYDKLIDSAMLVNFRDAAKVIGISQTQFTGWLRDKGYIYMNEDGELRPREPYMKSDLFEMKPYKNRYNGRTGVRTLITSRGLTAFKMLLDDSGHNRDTMKKHGGRNYAKTNK